MNKKLPLVLSFSLAAVLVMGQGVFAQDANDERMGNMMNGNGMMNMMEAMNSPEGQEMMNACEKFMESESDDIEKSNNTF